MNRIGLCAAMLLSVMASFSMAASRTPDLTPIGAERLGNEDGSIPSWKGGLSATDVRSDARGGYIDPFADEKPLFVIDESNVKEYRQWLSPAQMGMLKRHAGTFRMPVYPSHRTAAYPQAVYDQTQKNRDAVKTVKKGLGLTGHLSGVAFYQPRTAQEVIWNHLTRYRGASQDRYFSFAKVHVSGMYDTARINTVLNYGESIRGDNEQDGILLLFKSRIVEPARYAGDAVMVHEMLDPQEQPRSVWMYSAEQRRIRRAPAATYDYAARMTDGLVISDTIDGFNGTLARYDWKLLGKREMFIPYNSFRLADRQLKYNDLIKPGHIDPQYTRYEKHRVWVVEATLKPGARSPYSKRVFYIDEDTWSIAMIDLYSPKGSLWRLYESHQMPYPDLGFSFEALSTYYDLATGHYAVNHMTNEEQKTIRTGFTSSVHDFTPSGLKRWVN